MLGMNSWVVLGVEHLGEKSFGFLRMLFSSLPALRDRFNAGLTKSVVES